MTSTPVSDATLFFSNISTKNQNVTGLGSASESFSEVMNKTSNHNVGAYSQQNQVADTSEDTGKVSGKGEDLESENRIQEEPTEKVDKAEKSTGVEETQNTDETAETVKDELEEKAEELVQEIAKELGVSFNTVNRWETGKQKPSIKVMRVIDDYCKKNNIDFDIADKIASS